METQGWREPRLQLHKFQEDSADGWSVAAQNWDCHILEVSKLLIKTWITMWDIQVTPWKSAEQSSTCFRLILLFPCSSLGPYGLGATRTTRSDPRWIIIVGWIWIWLRWRARWSAAWNRCSSSVRTRGKELERNGVIVVCVSSVLRDTVDGNTVEWAGPPSATGELGMMSVCYSRSCMTAELVKGRGVTASYRIWTRW